MKYFRTSERRFSPEAWWRSVTTSSTAGVSGTKSFILSLLGISREEGNIVYRDYTGMI